MTVHKILSGPKSLKYCEFNLQYNKKEQQSSRARKNSMFDIHAHCNLADYNQSWCEKYYTSGE